MIFISNTLAKSKDVKAIIVLEYLLLASGNIRLVLSAVILKEISFRFPENEKKMFNILIRKRYAKLINK